MGTLTCHCTGGLTMLSANQPVCRVSPRRSHLNPTGGKCMAEDTAPVCQVVYVSSSQQLHSLRTMKEVLSGVLPLSVCFLRNDLADTSLRYYINHMRFKLFAPISWFIQPSYFSTTFERVWENLRNKLAPKLKNLYYLVHLNGREDCRKPFCSFSFFSNLHQPLQRLPLDVHKKQETIHEQVYIVQLHKRNEGGENFFCEYLNKEN